MVKGKVAAARSSGAVKPTKINHKSKTTTTTTKATAPTPATPVHDDEQDEDSSDYDDDQVEAMLQGTAEINGQESGEEDDEDEDDSGEESDDVTEEGMARLMEVSGSSCDVNSATTSRERDTELCSFPFLSSCSVMWILRNWVCLGPTMKMMKTMKKTRKKTRK
jgi:hypothetical protein